MYQNWLHKNLIYNFCTVLLFASLLFNAFSPALSYANEVEPTENTSLEIEEITTEAPTENIEDEVEEDEELMEDDEEEALDELEIPDTVEDGTETIVETGDATASLEAESHINTNETDTRASSTEEESGDDEESTSTSTEETSNNSSSTPAFGFSDHSSTTVSNTNEATSTLSATTSANTGDNVASGQTVTIDTGSAVAYADVLNVVNTNITNSDGLVNFVNNVLGISDFDLRDDFDSAFGGFETALSTPSCSLSACNNGSTNYNVENNNSATIENNVTVIANTGGNAAAGGSANITTGNAYASANIVNIANTNITDSNYLLLVFNNFDDYSGNIVLPNSSFFDEYFSGGGAGNTDVSNTNTANVSNNVAVGADTGGNVASGGTIDTGDATAIGSVNNTLNTNMFGANSFSMLIRVNGSWSGDIYGLPDGMSWANTPEGIRIYSTASGTDGPRNAADRVHNNNTANITNNVNVFALTGDNAALGDETSITTGNAYAEASVYNMANTNIVSSNWSNLIFNIYGNWNGSLSFGQSDLWLGVRADYERSPLMPGASVTYTYTIFNRGDITANNVLLENTSATGLLSFADAEVAQKSGGVDSHSWQIGNIPAGGTKEISHTAKLYDGLPRNLESAIQLNAKVSSQQPDGNLEDNEDSVVVYAGKTRSKGTDYGGAFDAKVYIEKTADRTEINPGQTVNYKVKLTNNGGQLYDAALVDILEDSDGNKISEQVWPLEDVRTGETIEITYSTNFNEDTPSGKYTNYAQVIGLHSSTKPKYQVPYTSPLSDHTVTVTDGPVGEVLGVQTVAPTCPKYLSTYMRLGANNDPVEVEKLQMFLNNFGDVGIAVTSEFDLPTEIAVRDFQQKYQADILGPWGLENDSGYVYYTTQKKINEMACENLVAFPLSPEQKNEIAYFKQGGGRFALAKSPSGETEIPQPIIPPATLMSGLKNYMPAHHKLVQETKTDTKLISTTPKQVQRYQNVFTKLLNWARATTNRLGLSLR